jgi:hypothetical protein
MSAVPILGATALGRAGAHAQHSITRRARLTARAIRPGSRGWTPAEAVHYTRPMKRLITGALLVAVSAWSCSRTPAPAATDGIEATLASIEPRAIRAHMQFLADDLLEGRGTGERGYDIAARYVAAQMAATGLEPAFGDSWLQQVPFRSSTTERVDLAVASGARRTLQHERDYVIAPNPYETDVTVEAPVVFAGYGIIAPEAKHDDYAGLDVRGKVVVVLSGAPKGFANHLRAYYSQTREKLQIAADRGAVGMLGISSPSEAARTPWDLTVFYVGKRGIYWLNADGTPEAHPRSLRFRGVLNRSGGEAIFARASRRLEDVFAEAEEGAPKGMPLDVTVRVRHTSKHGTFQSPNVAGILRGSDPALKDEYFSYVAHLDHLGVGAPLDGDRINNGAYDNASGVGIMLEVASAFARLPARPARSIIVLAVTGEEEGLLGAEYFVHHPPVPLDRIVANVSLDMFLMLFPLRDVIGFGAEHSSLGPVLHRAAKRLGVAVLPDPMPEEVIFIRSDQFRFIQKGVPALFLVHGYDSGNPSVNGEELTTKWRRERYHRPSDDMQQPFDFQAGADFAKLNLLIGYEVANAPERPSWNEGDFFGQKYASAR